MESIVETYKLQQFIDTMYKNTPAKNHSRSYEPSYNFCNQTWDEGYKLAKNGIPQQKGLEKIIHTMSLLEHVKTLGFGMSETGLCVDVGAFLTGEPECWVAEQFDYKPKKCVKILVNLACSWNYRDEVIQNRGAGIIALIQMLKKQGYIVKVNLYDCCKYHGKHYTLFLKVPVNPLDVQSLSYALCSSTLNRRFIFAWLESVTHQRDCNTYGQPAPIDEVSISKDIIHFGGLNAERCGYSNEADTKEYIISLFDEFLKLNNDTKKRTKDYVV